MTRAKESAIAVIPLIQENVATPASVCCNGQQHFANLLRLQQSIATATHAKGCDMEGMGVEEGRAGDI